MVDILRGTNSHNQGVVMLLSPVRSSIAAAVLTLGLTTAAQAQNYSFSCVSNNSATNCATGVAQLGMTLAQGAGYVDFRFTNAGPLASSITDVYWDWTGASNRYTAGAITSSNGVSFSWGASPNNLPSGNGLTPSFSANLGADSNAPTRPNGVNPGEWVSFRLWTNLTSTAADLASGSMRVGLHVQGFANGGSESYVNRSTTVVAPVPEPEAYALMLAGLGVVGAVARRKRKQQA